jgi:hypothetical protein
VLAASSAYGTQSLTLAIPLGFFIVMIVVAFFQRNPSR